MWSRIEASCAKRGRGQNLGARSQGNERVREAYILHVVCQPLVLVQNLLLQWGELWRREQRARCWPVVHLSGWLVPVGGWQVAENWSGVAWLK